MLNLYYSCHKVVHPKLENNNATEHKPYWEYYNDDEVLLVQKAYQKDIELYNYEFEE